VRAERDEYLDALRRLQADFENYRKRATRLQGEVVERAAGDLVVKLLPVIDALDLARAHLADPASASVEGKALLQAAALLDDLLGREGLERIDQAGVPFDPESHEAVEHAPADATAGEVAAGEVAAGQAASGSQARQADGPVVSEVLRAGYRWKGRVVRPAMVKAQG
jgi:molecular chaperone GrpE